MNKVTILGVHVADMLMPEILEAISGCIQRNDQITVFPVNVDVVMKAFHDPKFREVLNAATITTSDGMPLVWASSWLGMPLREKVTGWILFEKICTMLGPRKYRVFFLGGAPGIPQRAAQRFMRTHGPINVVGTYSPPPGFENDRDEQEKMIQLINEKKPHVVFVGLGAPKQEFWIAENKKRLHTNVLMAVGGTFDFYAGKVRKPPLFVVHTGLGWFWRLVQEPRRLWRRYLVNDLPFFYHLFRHLLARERTVAGTSAVPDK